MRDVGQRLLGLGGAPAGRQVETVEWQPRSAVGEPGADQRRAGEEELVPGWEREKEIRRKIGSQAPISIPPARPPSSGHRTPRPGAMHGRKPVLRGMWRARMMSESLHLVLHVHLNPRWHHGLPRSRNGPPGPRQVKLAGGQQQAAVQGDPRGQPRRRIQRRSVHDGCGSAAARVRRAKGRPGLQSDVMDESRARHGRAMGESRASHGRVMGEPWASHGRVMGGGS